MFKFCTNIIFFEVVSMLSFLNVYVKNIIIVITIIIINIISIFISMIKLLQVR